MGIGMAMDYLAVQLGMAFVTFPFDCEKRFRQVTISNEYEHSQMRLLAHISRFDCLRMQAHFLLIHIRLFILEKYTQLFSRFRVMSFVIIQ